MYVVVIKSVYNIYKYTHIEKRKKFNIYKMNNFPAYIYKLLLQTILELRFFVEFYVIKNV